MLGNGVVSAINAEGSADGVVRNFCRDNGGLLSASDVVRAVESASRQVVLESTKLTLHVVHLDTERTRKLPEAYDRMKSGSWTSARFDHIAWVPWRAVLDAVVPLEGAPKPVRGTRYLSGSIRTFRGVYKLSKLVHQLVSTKGRRITCHMEDLVTRRMICRELGRVEVLRGIDNDHLLVQTLGGDWKLRLASPPSPPESPLEILKPADKDYKAMVAALPNQISSRVVSVRRVRASPRLGDYLLHKKHMSGNVQEIEPLYHGTPHRWRATAIALNGFDASIRLNGRSHGDGVYTASDLATAMPFFTSAGSLLQLRGIVTTNSPKSSENTIIHGCVHVFPDPKALLPVMIVDYAAEDELDQVELKRHNTEREYHIICDRRTEMERTMALKEKEFKRETGMRLKSAVEVYYSRLLMLRDGTRGEDDYTLKQRLKAQALSTSRKFFLERRHFKSGLPIYEVKPELVQLLTTTSVVIVVAETGSGKSTQLPQLLLDDVLPANEVRRIAILEPRRVNAISLCKRVSKERGLLPGQEVGYTLGVGMSNAQPSVARLEYMTHGLFVQLARDYDQLIANYCAVIVDEAHERSVDVDLSLALLQRTLMRHKHEIGGSPSFRVIVTSAIIGDEAEKFQIYLDSTKTQSAVFQVRGRTFPVHVQYRNDIQVNCQALGIAGTGKVLSSAAIQAAVELLRTTRDGNILVFLPGEGSINDALEVAKSEIAQSASVEMLDTFQSSSSAFYFRVSTLEPMDGVGSNTTTASSGLANVDRTEAGQIATTGPRSRQRVSIICVLGFHSKVSRAERDRVMYPRCSDWHLVVFTTNIAETGVTIPNVRYVIDTGLERRVRWNPDLDMNEMVTELISASSMAQRSGRAGRTASGICIRLFPEEYVDELIQPNVVPAVQNAMIYKAVLLNKQLETRGEPRLQLLDPIAPDAFGKAERRLADLGALDAEMANWREKAKRCFVLVLICASAGS